MHLSSAAKWLDAGRQTSLCHGYQKHLHLGAHTVKVERLGERGSIAAHVCIHSARDIMGKHEAGIVGLMDGHTWVFALGRRRKCGVGGTDGSLVELQTIAKFLLVADHVVVWGIQERRGRGGESEYVGEGNRC